MAKVPKKGPNSGGHICRVGGEFFTYFSYLYMDPYKDAQSLSASPLVILNKTVYFARIIYIIFIPFLVISVFIDHKTGFTCGGILLCSQLSCSKISCVLLGIAVILQCGYWSRVFLVFFGHVVHFCCVN